MGARATREAGRVSRTTRRCMPLLEAPSWLNSGDTSWQMTAATLVGFMSVPGLVVLYGGVMQKRWSINSMMLTFAAFAVVSHRLGAVRIQDGVRRPVPRNIPWRIPRELHRLSPDRSSVPRSSRARATSRCWGARRSRNPRWSTFQFVFAAITPILMLGWCWDASTSRRGSRSWPLWITFVYVVNAFLLWGGGYFGHHGALDFSGGYVIHLSAGVSGSWRRG